MKGVRPGYDVVSLFDSSWEAKEFSRTRNSRGLVRNLLNVFLGIVLLVATFSVLQYFLSANATSDITVSPEINQTEPPTIQPSQEVSAYIDAGPGYIGR